MALTYNPGILQVNYVYTLDGLTYTNQLHYRQRLTDEAATSLTLYSADIGAAAASNWSDNIQSLQTVSASLNTIILKMFDVFIKLPEIPPAPEGTPQKILPRESEIAIYESGLPMVGGVSGDYLPGFNSFRVQKNTSRPGRRGRGHANISGVPESGTTGNKLNDGDWTDWQANGDVFVKSPIVFADDIFTYHWDPVVFSITQAQVDNVVPQLCSVYGYNITGSSPKRLVGTMRKRKKKTL